MLPSSEVLSALTYLALSYPLVLYAFSPSRPLGKNTLAVTLAVLFGALAVKLWWDGSHDVSNYYRILEVSRHSSPFDVRKSYKQISRVLHPDKNPSPDAEAQFQRAKAAYDILMDEKQRDVYNRFGPGALAFDPRHDELHLITDISVIYVFWLVILFVTTVPLGSRASRTWGCIVGVALLVLQFTFSISEATIPAWLPGVPYMTEAELVVMCHRIFPGVLVALRCLSESCCKFWTRPRLRSFCFDALSFSLRTNLFSFSFFLYFFLFPCSLAILYFFFVVGGK